MSPHVHDCTGPDLTCPCGYVFTVPRVSFSIEIYDGAKVLVSQGFHCETLAPVIAELRRQADTLEALT